MVTRSQEPDSTFQREARFMGMRPSNHSKAPALSRGLEILEFLERRRAR